MTRLSDLFTARQLVALTTFSDLVQEGARAGQAAMRSAAGLSDDGIAARRRRHRCTAYADAVAVYLGIRRRTRPSRLLHRTICSWHDVTARQIAQHVRPSSDSDDLGLC